MGRASESAWRLAAAASAWGAFQNSTAWVTCSPLASRPQRMERLRCSQLLGKPGKNTSRPPWRLPSERRAASVLRMAASPERSSAPLEVPEAAGQTCRGTGVAWKDWSSRSSMSRTQARRWTTSGPSSSPSSSSRSSACWVTEARRWGSMHSTSRREGLRLPLRTFRRLERLIPAIRARVAWGMPLSSTRFLRYTLKWDMMAVSF